VDRMSNEGLEYIPETNNIYNVLSEEFETPTTDLKI
jgi:hypothetical protein